MRRLLLVAAVAGLGAATACGGSGSSTAASSRPAASATVATVPAPATSSASPYTPPVLPTPAATGALRLTAVGSVPGPTGEGRMLATEAPDGTLFAAGSGRSVVYVVDGTTKPAVAEHADAAVTGLAADSSNLWVATTQDLTRYDRTTGAATRTFPIVVASTGSDQLQDAAGRVWALTTRGALVVIDPATDAVRTVADPGAIGSFATDATGAYYVESGGATVVHVSAAGTTRSGPTGEKASTTLGPGPFSVYAQAVSDGTLVVVHAYGEGLDAALVTFDAATLEHLATAGTNLSAASVVGTLAGPLVVGNGAESFCPAGSACIARSVLATATATPAATIPAGQVVVALVGPYPAVLTTPPSGGGAVTIYRLQ